MNLPPRSLETTLKLAASISLCILCGCATEPQRTAPNGTPLKKNERVVHIESDPPGARVFFYAGAIKGGAVSGRQYLGSTPLDWIVEGNAKGYFKFPSALVVSLVYPPVAVFSADPPSGATNLFPQSQIMRGGTLATQGAKIPQAVFFDMHKPPEK